MKFLRILMVLMSFLYPHINIGQKTDLAAARTVSTRSVSRRKRREKRLYQKKKWKRRKQYQNKDFAYKSSKPRDQRFSNQQKLRRMYRNC